MVLFVLAFLGSVLLNFGLLTLIGLSSLGADSHIQEKFVSHNARAVDKVAIISVEGIIGLDVPDASDGFVKRQIDHVMKDKNVKAVVLRVNSPGGSVSGSDYIYHHLRVMLAKRKIPLVVSMGGMAASGGYYVSMAVGHEPDTIFAETTTFTGSIGVLIPHYDLAGLMDKIGAKEDSVLSAPLKGMGSISRPMTEKERKIFQAMVDNGFAQFKEVIRAGPRRFRQEPGRLGQAGDGANLHRRSSQEQRPGR